MKKNLKKVVAVLMTAAMVFGMTACGGNSGSSDSEMGETMAKIKESGKIVMGVNATYAPFEFHKTIDGEDQIVGFDIELGKAIAEELGVEFVVEDMAFDGLLPALATGKVDFLPGLAYSEERAENAAFTNPYHKSIQQVIMQKEDAETVPEDDTLAGKTIGVLKGSIQEKIFPTRYPDAELYQIGKITDLIAALKSGKIDGICMDYTPAVLYCKANPDLGLSKVSYELTDEEDSGSCVLVRKDNNEDLIEVINKVLARVIEDGSLQQWEDDAIEMMDMDDLV